MPTGRRRGQWGFGVASRWSLVVEDDASVLLAGPVPVGVDVRIHDDQLVELLTDERGVR